MGRGRASALPPLHLGFHRQAQGRPAFHRRLPAARHPDHEVHLRHQAGRHLLGTADIGWVTGHTYITYGPLACGATEIVFEGVPTYPDAGRFWKMIQDHKATIFYTAPPPSAPSSRRPTPIRRSIRRTTTFPPAHPGFGRRADQPGGLDGGITTTSAAAAAPSSIPSGRPKPAVT